MDWKPNKWIAVSLGFFLQPLGMLYIARPQLAFIYFIAIFMAGAANVWLHSQIVGLPGYLSFTLLIMLVCASHIFLILRTENPLSDRPWFSRWYGLLIFPAILFTAIFTFRSLAFEPFKIPASSMSPSLNPDDVMIVQKWGYGNYGSYGISLTKKPITKVLNRGDVIAFEFPKNPNVNYVKRIIGLPGDIVEYKRGYLAINDKKVNRELETSIGEFDTYREFIGTMNYSILTMPNRPAPSKRITVPDGHLFVLGDNRDNSNDSRYWGFVPIENIIGKMVYTF